MNASPIGGLVKPRRRRRSRHSAFGRRHSKFSHARVSALNVAGGPRFAVDLAGIVHTKGAPSLRSLQGWEEGRVAELLISLTQPTHGGAPSFAHFAKGGNSES